MGGSLFLEVLETFFLAGGTAFPTPPAGGVIGFYRDKRVFFLRPLAAAKKDEPNPRLKASGASRRLKARRPLEPKWRPRTGRLRYDECQGPSGLKNEYGGRVAVGEQEPTLSSPVVFFYRWRLGTGTDLSFPAVVFK